MQTSSATLVFAACGTVLLAGCSSGNGLLGNAVTTQSISTQPAASTTIAGVQRIDPACYALAQRIQTLRADGLTERLEKAGTGSSATVSVKRASLAQAAELDKANAEFQAKCSTVPKSAMQTADATPAPAAKAEAVKTVAKAETAAKPKP